MGLAFLALGAMRLAAIETPVGKDGLRARQVYLTQLTTHHILHLGAASALIFRLALITSLGRPKERVNGKGQ